jgi:hypothetical protein
MFAPKLNKPLTALDTLKAAPPFKVNAVRRPRLTARGKVLVLMTVAFGVVAILVSLALISAFARTGLTPASVPAVAMILLIEFLPIRFGVVLHELANSCLPGNSRPGLLLPRV